MHDDDDDYPLICDDDARDDIEFRRFMRKVIPEVLAETERNLAYFKSGRRLPVSELVKILVDGWAVLELVWRASSPRQKRRYEDRLAPFWAQLRPLLKQNYERAKAGMERVN
jgi:hypothetical protein